MSVMNDLKRDTGIYMCIFNGAFVFLEDVYNFLVGYSALVFLQFQFTEMCGITVLARCGNQLLLSCEHFTCRTF